MTSGTAPVPMTTASASTTRPEAHTTRSTRSAPSKRSSGSPQTSSTPLLCSRSAKNRPAVGAEAGLQRRGLHHHHRAALAEGGQRRRHLAGDVGAADEHDVLGLGRVGPDRVGVAERAQVVQAGELAALHPQPPDVRARGHQRDAVLHDLLGGERRRAGGRVELHHARAGRQLDRAPRVPGLVVQEALRALHAARQIALGGRRALVRRVGLAPDEQHLAGEVALAQRLGAGGGRAAPADDQRADGPVSHARWPRTTR